MKAFFNFSNMEKYLISIFYLSRHSRMNDWESANMWRARKKNTATTLHQFSIIAATTALKELEALLIYYGINLFHILIKKNSIK